MFEKLKKFLFKFNKKENEEKVEKKKKGKLASFIGLIFLSLISTFLLEYLGIFSILNSPNISVSVPSEGTITSKTIEEDFIIDDFIYENYISKQDENAYMYEGLKDIKEYYLDFINVYSSYALKNLEGKEFILDNNKYAYSDDKYEYIYNIATHTITIVGENLTYQNLDNLIKVKLTGKKDYQILLEDTTLSFIYDDKEYIFDLEEDNFTITYNEGTVIEHYLLSSCSLYYYELDIAGHIYNTYIYDQIKKDKNIIYNEEEGKYFIEDSEEEVYNHNFDLETPNYYATEITIYNIELEELTLIALVVLQSYITENGIPLI